MILAEDELAIGTDHAGILVLDENGYSPGTPLADVLPIVDDVLELEITPNRPDCLGVYGVAREVHAATGAALAAPPWLDGPGRGRRGPGRRGPGRGARSCARASPRACSRTSRSRPSPPWLKARLMAAGQRPISNVVDITNYVMLLTAQPLHAFDFDRVAGGRLVVRRAREGEEVETLDGERRRLDPDVVVIDDADGPTSIAGIMGGARSEVDGGHDPGPDGGGHLERRPTSIAARCGSGCAARPPARFEKQLQPEFAMQAQAVARPADGRAVRRDPGAGHRRRRRPGPPPRDGPPARAARQRAARRADRARAPAGDPRVARVRRRRRRRRARRHRAVAPPRRRDPRGRPDRGGRAHRRRRPAPGHAAGPPGRRAAR